MAVIDYLLDSDLRYPKIEIPVSQLPGPRPNNLMVREINFTFWIVFPAESQLWKHDGIQLRRTRK